MLQGREEQKIGAIPTAENKKKRERSTERFIREEGGKTPYYVRSDDKTIQISKERT